MDHGLIDRPPVDVDACAAEPIRIPGAIQPHGALLVVDPADLRVLHRSANLAEVLELEIPAEALLGDVAGCETLAGDLERWRSGGAAGLLRTVRLPRGEMQVLAHQNAQGLVVEFEEPPASKAETLEELYPRLRQFLAAIGKAGDMVAIAEAAVLEVAALTGFNRVMLYRFDEKGDGHVLAQQTDGVLPSYLGHRFPASDIPAQARDLYRLNRIRLIPDASYVPAPVLPATSPVDGQPLDLSFAALRSVSPVHLEYMRNMGTGSSMSISILVEGELWGLISGHSRDPRRVNAQVRTACDILGEVLSLQIEARQQAHRTQERLRLREVETELLGRLAVWRNLPSGLADNADLWMGMTGAAGAAIVTENEVRTVGLAPPASAVRAIAHDLHAEGLDTFATESMAERWPEAARYASEASGLIAVSISQIHANYIVWFRPEVVRTIDWAGDPTKPMQAGPHRLHPRKSFEAWREQVRLRATSWTPMEIESADGFRSSIQTLVLRRAEERAELTDRLERANTELEAFSYSVSHDLRAPFRHIVGFSELLMDREKNLDEKARHYLQSIVDSALAAGRLVDDLLNFSQLGRSNLATSAVDMNKLVAEVMRGVEATVEPGSVEWRIAPLPRAFGDPSLLRQVWQNLIENAVKYSASRKPAIIAIEGRDLGDRAAYVIRDNGVGFEMEYVGKLFGVFQRLHRAEDFEGTGIGLALVKRIVDRHGGQVSAVGKPDEGAEFTFILPKHPAGPTGEQLRG